MIRLETILTPGRSHVSVPGTSKEAVLQHIAEIAAADLPGHDAQSIFESLLAREKLGSTGFGNGIAIPHCRLSGSKEPLSVLCHLQTPVDFDSLDGAPVDLIFVLLVPEAATEQHLELLRQIAAMLDKADMRDHLRHATTSRELHQIVIDAQSGQ
ncbi:phosphotransferase IIA-like nitrogen-regulatory protein PtsN [Pseudomonas duriflava]|uniref:Phosphotransferase IIA-like nitrogen-regulatory protein PtsN n=1 Tax=Pseudomonas duriflava TaxID=459528 RepID=A0A562QGS5_9PSED|nr:PTS IIA-like nitrogen regulatory protein PtsN [Pseudomonas duriflava]TWI55390.1 phosphotransferase IIA-like nitrogen-regulatory protein PtsN [Pseudomonas duriflava]